MTAVAISFGCAWQRNASVLLWTPVLLLGPVLDVGGGAPMVAFKLGLVAVMAACAAGVVLTTGRTPYVALTTLAAATFAGAQHGGEWLPTWILLALTVPSVLRGRWIAVALPVVTAASMWAAWLVQPRSAERVWSEGFVVLLAGLANTAVLKLIDTIEELRRTRQELARSAVAEERERFSRDLHDLLGHTLSVMVVKAEAVGRLVDRDPEAAAAHAADIEQVGRDALVQVREAVDATRSLSLGDELDGARRALDAAGIRTDVSTYDGRLPAQAEDAFAWVVREGATNVLRHSAAAHCSFDVRDDDGGQLVLTVSDDGVGGPATSPGRQGGLEGLRRRLAAAGGRLDVEPAATGFRLTARLPLEA